jgi:predicted phage-related endonuclease
MVAKPKNVTLAEEKAAAKAEEKRPTKPISSHNFARWQHAHAIKEQIKPLEAQLKLIQGHIYSEMDNKGVDVLTRKGVEIVSRDEVTGADQFDMERFKKEHPNLYRKYYLGRKANYFRINWKTLIRFN